jgi:ABC-2 type transport system permease protein
LALIPTLVHVFVLSLSVQCVGSELKGGTAPEWLASANGSLATALAGKFLPYSLWFTALGIALLEWAMQSLDLPMAGSRALLYLGVALLVLSYQALGLFLIAATANFRLSSSLAGFLAGPAFAVAGVSFPRFAMPVAAQWWSAALPLTHYLQLQTAQVIAGADPRHSLASLGMLGAFTVVLAGVALHRLPRLVREPKYWGRI